MSPVRFIFNHEQFGEDAKTDNEDRIGEEEIGNGATDGAENIGNGARTGGEEFIDNESLPFLDSVHRSGMSNTTVGSLWGRCRTFEINFLTVGFVTLFVWEAIQAGGNVGNSLLIAIYFILSMKVLYDLHAIIRLNAYGSISAVLANLESVSNSRLFIRTLDRFILVYFIIIFMNFSNTFGFYVAALVGLLLIILGLPAFLTSSFLVVYFCEIKRDKWRTILHRAGVVSFVAGNVILFILISILQGTSVTAALMFFLSLACFINFHKLQSTYMTSQRGNLMLFEAIGFLSLLSSVVFSVSTYRNEIRAL
jgi:hypothetical protein